MKSCRRHDIINEIQFWRKDHVPFLRVGSRYDRRRQQRVHDSHVRRSDRGVLLLYDPPGKQAQKRRSATTSRPSAASSATSSPSRTIPSSSRPRPTASAWSSPSSLFPPTTRRKRKLPSRRLPLWLPARQRKKRPRRKSKPSGPDLHTDRLKLRLQPVLFMPGQTYAWSNEANSE